MKGSTERMGSGDRFVAFFGGVAMLIVCIVVVRDFLSENRLVRESLAWPSTDGTITCSQLEKESDGKTWFKLNYSYVIDGREFQGYLIRMSGAGQNAKSTCVRYPVGRAVNVYYDPEIPARSCLEPGSEGWKDGLILAAKIAFMSLVGLLGVLSIVVSVVETVKR